MAYRLEKKDIVIDGWEQGISDTPYNGIADMRNIDIISYPGEALVGFSMSAITKPPVYNAISYTAQNSGDTITVATTSGMYAGMAFRLVTNSAGGLSTGVVYYAQNITATTFTVSLDPRNLSAVAVTSDGSGTLTTYQYGNQRGVSAGNGNSPQRYFIEQRGDIGSAVTLLIDSSNYAWLILSNSLSPLVTDTLYFLGNIGGAATKTGSSGIAFWKDYVLIINNASTAAIDIAELDNLLSAGPASAWDYSWETVTMLNTTSANPQMIVSQEDDNVYFTARNGLGSIIEQPNEIFDPTDTTTYQITSTAVLIPTSDFPLCVSELGSNLYIGGINQYVYVWDKTSPGFNQIITIPERYTPLIVSTDQNTFFFSGNRGRIYICNGASVDLYKKIPDYVSGTTNPFYQWGDGSSSRGQLYFSATAFSNSNSQLTTTNGAWGIDLESKALRLINKVTNSGYSGLSKMVIEKPRPTTTSQTQPVGNGLLIGWNVSTTTYGVDVNSSSPYSSSESYIDTDLIPVGTYLSPFTPKQIEWKTSVPLGDNGTSESISIYYRENLNDSFTLLGTSTSSTGLIEGVTAVSDIFETNFEKIQWLQFRIVTSSNSTTPTFCRLTELRIRDFPSTINT